jgi:hypothetical protein
MAGRLCIEVLNLLIALENFECILLHDRNDSHRSTASISAVGAEAVVNFVGLLAVFKMNRVVRTATLAGYRKICSCHLSLLS